MSILNGQHAAPIAAEPSAAELPGANGVHQAEPAEPTKPPAIAGKTMDDVWALLAELQREIRLEAGQGLLSHGALARRLSVSNRTLSKRKSMGQLPEAIAWGGADFWSAREIENWISAGCPDREAWAAMKTANRNAEERKQRRGRRGQAAPVANGREREEERGLEGFHLAGVRSGLAPHPSAKP